MDSIRNLPTTATFGWSAIFFYAIAVLTYLIPVALCSAELATTVGGGMYRWVREAFGSRWGFLAVWCDWSENIVWFPTVLVFLATTAAYVINPDLAENKAFLVPVMLIIFWAVTAFSTLRVAEVGALDGHRRDHRHGRADRGHHRPGPVVDGQRQALGDPVPRQRHRARLARPGQPGLRGRDRGRLRRHGDRRLLLPRDQERQADLPRMRCWWPRPPWRCCPSWAAWPSPWWCPSEQIQLAGGIMQAVSIFFTKLGISSLIKPFGVLIIIGVLCGLASWSLGPAEGMRRVAADGHLNPWWGRTNRRGAPTSVLILQATLGSLLALVMVFVNNINTYYWMLTALVAQTFLVMYFLMYVSVLRLRKTEPDAPRPFKIPGGKPGLCPGHRARASSGRCSPSSWASSRPPTCRRPGTIAYVAVMAFGMLVIVGTPFLLHRGPSLKTDSQVDPYLAGPTGD